MLRDDTIEQLLEAIIVIKDKEECKNFFDDIFTIQEIEKIAQRLEAARLLIDGKTYEQVIDETSISSTTLSRISRCIRYGNGGYKKVLEKIKKPVE